ncbi:TonB-dependent receptor [candidate division WOR-3 bacterium]|nr:TonB-dependent receptor [candidate division WOR-3 bacterium]
MYTRQKVIWFLLFLFSMQLYAGITGKIAGKIVDAKTGEPLPMVNIFIPGTRFGAATDKQGAYYILQLPPGKYTLIGRMMGYKDVTVKGVRVIADRTAIINFDLESTLIKGVGIIITAKRPLIEPDVTSSVKYLSDEEIARMPDVEEASDLMRLQPGVIGTHVRGGRTGETVYYIDGIAIRDPIRGATSALDINVVSIKEMEMLTGGFSAEYGNAQSGIVNIITKEGGKKLSGQWLYKTDNRSPAGSSFNTDYSAFSIGGPISFLPSDFRFFLSGGGRLTDTYLNNHRAREEREFFGIKFHDHQDNNAHINFKLTYYNISPDFKLSLGYRRRNHWYSGFNWDWKDLPDSTNNTEEMSSQTVLSFTHTLSENTFYTIHLGYLFTHSHSDLWGRTPPEFWHWEYYWDPTEWNITQYRYRWSSTDSVIIDSMAIDSIPLDSALVDSELVSNTNWGSDTDGDGFIDEGVYQYWSDDSSWVWSVKFDITSQIHPYHLVRFGFSVDYEDVSYTNIQYHGSFRSPGADRPGPWPDYGLYRWVFQHGHPWMGSAYIQDKIELSSLVVNAGVRLDYFTPGEAIIGDTLYQKQWEKATGMKWELERKLFFSPRLGISHPITENTCIYFNYGRFQQIPGLQYVFRDPWTGTWCGNPNLKPQKTIQYEFGLSHKFATDIAAYLKLFNKDMYDYVGLMKVGMPPIWVWVNRGYGRAQGIELELMKRYSHHIAGNISYTYQHSRGYSSWEFMEYYEGWEWIPVRGTRLDWDQAHKIVGNISIEAHEGEHIFGILPDRWRLDLLLNFGSGLPYTPKDDPTLKNEGSRPYTSKVDVHFQKEFSIGEGNLRLFFDILNLLNNRNVNWVNLWTGKPYKYGNTDGASHRIYRWREIQHSRNPQMFGAPRHIKLGLEISF